jgi:hypothetical protein
MLVYSKQLDNKKYGFPFDFPIVEVNISINAEKGKYGQGDSILGINPKINSFYLKKVKIVEKNK